MTFPGLHPRSLAIAGWLIACAAMSFAAGLRSLPTLVVGSGSLSDASLTFDSQTVGLSSAAKTITLSNSQAVILTITRIAVTGDFVQTNNCGPTLTKGASCSISIAFTPTATGNRTGILTVTDSAGNSPQIASLGGSGLAPVSQISLGSATVNFASQLVGTASAASAVTLTNSGTGPLTLASVAATGDFAQTNTCGTSVAVGASCAIAVTFNPSAPGNRAGSLRISGNAPAGPAMVSLSGQGTAPTLVLAPGSLTFPSQTAGTTGNASAVTLTNSGTAALTISSITATGDFSQSNNCAATVDVGASCIVAVSFTPTAAGSRSGALTVTANAARSPQSIPLGGTGLAPMPNVSLSQTSVSFGPQLVRSASPAITVTLTNNGTGPLNISSIVSPDDFVQSNTCGSSVAVGASCTIAVSFSPSTTGKRGGQLKIVDSAANSPQAISLDGQATAPSLSLGTASLIFGGQTVGVPSNSQSVMLTNSGTAPLTISNIVATGDFSQTNACGFQLAAGASCAVFVSFLPTAVGNRTGQLQVAGNVPNSPLSVSLSGTGLVPLTQVSLSSASMNFSVQPVGAPSAAQTITLTNIGNVTLSLSISVSNKAFAQTNTCGASVAAGASCAITATFTPAISGRLVAAINLSGNIANPPLSIGICGIGVPAIPQGVLSTTSLTFAAQTVGTVSPAQLVTLTNSGNVAVKISRIASQISDYLQTNNCPSTLAVGAGCTIAVTFSPVTVGRRYGSVWIYDNSVGSPHGIAYSGVGQILTPTATLSPSTLTFDNQVANSTNETLTVMLTNTGSADMTVFSIATSGNYTATNTCTAPIPAGTSCSIPVTFAPTAPGLRKGALSVLDNAPNGPHSIPLAGTGLVPVPGASLSLASLSFASQTVGTSSTAQTVTLTNIGTGPLTISGITLPGDFAQTSNCIPTVPVGASCTISVTFAPVGAGNRGGNLKVWDNSPNSPQVLALSGPATAPSVSLAPAWLTMAAVTVGLTGLARTVTLTNTGTDVLNTASISATGDFAQTNTCGAAVAVGASCTISIAFTPTAVGARTGSLTFADNAANSPQVLSLAGSGLAPVFKAALSPFSLSFPAQAVSATSGLQTLILTNTGTGPLAVSQIAATGDFAQTSTCGSTLAFGANCAISVTFTPSATGKRAGTLTVTDNAPNSPQSINLAGTGVAAVLAATLGPSSLSFSAQQVGTASDPQTLTLSNTGNVPLSVSQIAATGAFTQTNTCGASLAAGASCAISVTFAPTAPGSLSGTLTVTDNAATPVQSVSLAGTGQPAPPAASLTPAALTFADQTVGATSASQSLTLTNTGGSDLAISGITATGDFAQTNNCGSTLPAAATCSISVTFTPTVAGARSGAITVADNAAGAPHSAVLSGNGIASASSGGCVETGTLNFPSCLALGSPTQMAANPNQSTARARTRSKSRPMDASAGAFESKTAAQTAQIAQLLAGSDPNPGQTLANLGAAALAANVSGLAQSANSCFAPAVYYANDPDAGSGTFPSTGEWAAGSLGIWQPTDSGGQACVAAELNYLLQSGSARTQLALAMAAEVQSLAGTSFPAAAGQSFDATAALGQLLAAGAQATVTSATVSFDGTNYLYNTQLALASAGQQSGSPGTVNATLALKHTPGASSAVYAGVVQYGFDDGTSLLAGTTRYQRTSQTHLDISARDTFYPSATVPQLNANGEIDPNDPNFTQLFSRMGASFDPTAALTPGAFLLALTTNPQGVSGATQNPTQVFQLSLPGDGTGSAYYGLGAGAINLPAAGQTGAAAGTAAGTIDQFTCSPQSGTSQSYAQFQPLSYDSTAGQYIPSATVAAAIRFAPTASCAYTDSAWNSGAAGGFWYDRDLQFSASPSQPTPPSQIPQGVVADPNDSSFPFALFGDGATQPQALIIQAGYSFPALY